MARKSTGKRTRFEIFKRDHFTCQYCGAQPPDVVLVLDHIDPVASGGTNDLLNLTTSCEQCNQGKSDKSLGDGMVRPDADLLYLQTRQEIAESERYIDALRVREDRLEQLTDALVQRWFVYDTNAEYAPSWLPATVRSLLGRYDTAIVDAAIADVAGKVATGYLERGRPTDRYINAVARNMAAEAEEAD